MAEFYLRSHLPAPSRHRVLSRGTLGLHDDPAAEAAIAVMRLESDVDLSPHRSRGLKREEIEDADLILVMERRHRRYLATLYPAHIGKVRLLTDYAPPGSGVAPGSNIFDPMGMDPEAFRECYHLIQVCMDAFIKQLQE